MPTGQLVLQKSTNAQLAWRATIRRNCWILRAILTLWVVRVTSRTTLLNRQPRSGRFGWRSKSILRATTRSWPKTCALSAGRVSHASGFQTCFALGAGLCAISNGAARSSTRPRTLSTTSTTFGKFVCWLLLTQPGSST